eukprot:1212049-Prymnesium_polylepis.2
MTRPQEEVGRLPRLPKAISYPSPPTSRSRVVLCRASAPGAACPGCTVHSPVPAIACSLAG